MTTKSFEQGLIALVGGVIHSSIRCPSSSGQNHKGLAKMIYGGSNEENHLLCVLRYLLVKFMPTGTMQKNIHQAFGFDVLKDCRTESDF